MPVFHTKTIEGILEPVAQQVSRLVILHEEAEDGNAMPDLEKPVMAVSKAVVNLVKVGRETINSSDDPILKQDMPAALNRVESAAKLLEEASSLLKADPYSQPARKKLIEGARGILQGTSALLLCFDESEVRKIIRECKKVLDYLAVAEVIETMEDLVQFVKDLSPCLTRVSRDVDGRQQELTHQVHREILMRCLEGVKTLSPILICSMKIFIQIFHQGGKGIEEAAENRNYLAGRMTDEINEIIRVLQLTTYDEEEWDADNLTVMKKALNAIDGKAQAAHDWLLDPTALRGGIGEKSLRQILAQADKVADRSLPPDRDAIKKLSGDISSMTDALCELRQDGKGTTPQGQSLARSIGEKLNELSGAISRAVSNVERSGVQQPAHTVAGRLEQAQRWLNNPSLDDKGLGQQAIGLIVEEGKRVAAGLTGPAQADILALCDEVDGLSQQLSEMCRRGQGDSPQAQAIARALSTKLQEMKHKIQTAVVDRVVEDFVDITTPLKQFTDSVLAPEGTPGREQAFDNRAANLANFSNRAAKTALMVAAGSSGGNKKLTEALLASSGQVESLTPQLVAAGRIRMTYPTNKAADEHFENLRRQYAESIQKVRDLADEATDSAAFIKASENLIKKHTAACESSIATHEPQSMVDNTSAIARLANRVLMVAKQEADNSEDPGFVAKVNAASDQLQAAVTPMVQNAKDVAMNPDDQRAIGRWRQSNQALLTAVGEVRRAVMVYPDEEPIIPPPPDMSALSLSDQAPPRPPLPGGEKAPPRPPPPETDDEDETNMFSEAPLPSQPIMMAAHGLHQEVRQWSSRDNDIIAAAKKMALLMARLSQLVRGEGGTKKDLIACAKAIAEASEEVTRLAKDLARECTDKRMRTNLLQVCERIPTIGTQLKILSTVKATMLGAQAAWRVPGMPRVVLLALLALLSPSAEGQKIVPEGYQRDIRPVVRMQFKLGCAMTFEKYPFDTQECLFYITSYSYSDEELKFAWMEIGLSEDPELEKQLPNYDFHFVRYNDTECLCTNCVPQRTSCIKVLLVLRRRSLIHVLGSFIPSSLFVLVGWASLFWPADVIPGRTVLAITSLLTVTSMYSAIRQSSPATSYVQTIDVWLFMCIVLTMVPLFQYALVLMWREKRNGSRLQVVKPQPKLKPKCLYIHKYTVYEARTERIGRLGIPLAFLVFNLVYWPVFL